VTDWPMWLLGVVTLVDQVDQNLIRGLIPQVQAEFGVSDAAMGVLLSSFIVVNGVVTVPAGYLADRLDRTRTIGHTVLLWSAITVLTAVMPTFGLLILVRSALGFGQAITEPATASLLADYYPMDRRGKAFSIQQALLLVGVGMGVGIGGAIGATLGWRWAYVLVGPVGLAVALGAYRLREPTRGEGDRLSAGAVSAAAVAPEPTGSVLENGFVEFVRDMVQGLREDLRTILSIPTMRYALIGVAALLFTISAQGSWLPQYYVRQLGLTEGEATAYFAVIVMFGGLPGMLLGGRVADRYATRIRGARMAIPGYCMLIGFTFVTISYFRLPFWPTYILDWIGFFFITMAMPSLRAGLSDAVPANLRGAGFGAFNLIAMVFGAAAAPVLVAGLAQIFDNNLRTAFLLVTPPVYIGALMLLKARNHLDDDMAKIFQAIVTAVQQRDEDQRRDHPTVGSREGH